MDFHSDLFAQSLERIYELGKIGSEPVEFDEHYHSEHTAHYRLRDVDYVGAFGSAFGADFCEYAYRVAADDGYYRFHIIVLLCVCQILSKIHSSEEYS